MAASAEGPSAQIAPVKRQEIKHAKNLRIFLLGPPVITWCDEVLSISRRQVRALLYRLSADLQPIPREQLCDLIWPEVPLPKARRSLTHLLTHLRLALPEPDLVEFTSETIALNPARTWSDTVALAKLYAERYKLLRGYPGSEDDSPLLLTPLENVIQSYRGPFLSNFNLSDSQEFEAWVSQQRQYYECRYLEILSDLIDYYHHHKDHDKAIAYAKRYLEIDSLAEEVHCKLIELYAAIGDRSAAERQFEACAASLEQELGVSPSPKTWAVYQSAAGNRPSGALISPHALAKRSQNGLETPFVGRDDLLAAIDQAYNLAISGRGKVILISGEPGIGKSRLLQQIATHYHCSSTVLFSACSQGLKNLAFYPIAQAFRPVIESQNLSITLSPLWLAEAARLLPEIYSRFPELPASQPARPDEGRRRLFEALSRLAASLQSRFRPLVLCLDDLQWADATTLEWLTYLANQMAFEGLGHILIIGAYQFEEAQPLAELRHALNRLGLLEEYSLTSLAPDEVSQILAFHLGAQQGQQNPAARLHQISGGNPFYLLEILQALIDSHLLPGQPIDPKTLPVPKTVQEALRLRLASADPLERMILELLAVLSHPVHFDMLPELVPAAELETLQAIDRLASRRLLAEREGVYQFAFDLLRLVVYNDISYAQRRIFHRRCARLLEKYFPAEIALLAWHFEQSGEPGKAADYALRAGANSIQALAFGDALDFFSRALNSLKQEAATLTAQEDIAANYRRQIAALSQRSSVFRTLGEMQSNQDDLAEEARLAAALGDQSALAQVCIREANAHRWFCRYLQARECAEKALQLSLAIGDRHLQARSLREIGLAERALGDFASAEASLKQALQLFHDLEETSYEVHTLCNLSALYIYTGNLRRAEKFAQDALTCCEQVKLPFLRRIALGDLGVALAGSGRIDQGRECLLSSLDIAREIGDRTQEIFCLCHLGWLENQAGRAEHALGYLREGLSLAERLDSRAEQSRLYAGLADAHRLLDNIRLAKSFAHKSIELARLHHRRYDQELAEQIMAKIEEKL
jgi:DNA-binding SARP family transcriptional activator